MLSKMAASSSRLADRRCAQRLLNRCQRLVVRTLATNPTALHHLAQNSPYLHAHSSMPSSSTDIRFMTSLVGSCSPGLLRQIDRTIANSMRALHTSAVRHQKSDRAAKDDDKNKPEDEDPETQKMMTRAFFVLVMGLATMIVLGQIVQNGNGTATCTADALFHELLPSGEVKEITIRQPYGMAYITLHDNAVIGGITLPGKQVFILNLATHFGGSDGSSGGIIRSFEQKLIEAETELNIPPSKRIPIKYEDWNLFANLQMAVVLLTFAYFWFMAFRVVSKKFTFSVGSVFDRVRKANYRLIDRKGTSEGSAKTPKIKFKDIAGLHEAKVEVKEFVDYLQRPETYTRLGAKLPKGGLLLGPPGCGKTLLAKAVATEADVPFMAMSGSDFVEMIGGLGAARVRDLFKDARKRAPCIIFIDEVDAVGKQRSEGTGGNFGGNSSETEQTLNQLLVEMDGMGTDSGVVVMASTNRADMLDKALLRRGRFDRHIQIDLPTLIERAEIFELYLRKLKLEENCKTEPYRLRLAQLTPGFSGADIANVVNEAAIHAATNQKKIVSSDDISHAMERVIAGAEKKSTVLAPEEREIVAYHESGHALVGWLLQHTDALLKVTIIPRTSAALGFAQYSPVDRKLFSKEELFDRMCMALGGRVAESLTFTRITTGAQNDLEKVTQMAYAQVKNYGMSDVVGPIAWNPTSREQDLQEKPYSRYLANVIDIEASRIVSEAYKHTEQVLRSNKDKLETLSQALLKHETLTYDDVRRLLGPPPFGEKQKVESADPTQLFPKPETTSI